MDNCYPAAARMSYQPSASAVDDSASHFSCKNRVDDKSKILELPRKRVPGEGLEVRDPVIVPFDAFQREIKGKDPKTPCCKPARSIREKTPLLESHETVAN